MAELAPQKQKDAHPRGEQPHEERPHTSHRLPFTHQHLAAPKLPGLGRGRQLRSVRRPRTGSPRGRPSEGSQLAPRCGSVCDPLPQHRSAEQQRQAPTPEPSSGRPGAPSQLDLHLCAGTPQVGSLVVSSPPPCRSTRGFLPRRAVSAGQQRPASHTPSPCEAQPRARCRSADLGAVRAQAPAGGAAAGRGPGQLTAPPPKIKRGPTAQLLA